MYKIVIWPEGEIVDRNLKQSEAKGYVEAFNLATEGTDWRAEMVEEKEGPS